MAVDVDIDVEVLKSEIKKTYASLSERPEQDFVFPTGRGWAEDLDYPRARERSRVCGRVVRRRCESVLARPAALR